ncbi:hypothetical protein [Janthinobacterium sp. 17J80-10]|uniref:hypothetical protein n=1 Tax=Janthinobacterium sp. 17J80-10 TaxID=2497863 RepID=UPI00100540BF|nr:hypothetical protein [Janthinobacterium sp. 17J80-10]QAU33273.1 hypothetical protein EKL02_03225 [Janthinobacterium sp. 17J80-10]
MRPHFQLSRALLRLLSLLPILLLALSAQAGNISFNLSITGNTLTLSNQGDSPAFQPSVLRLLDDGRWEVLQPAPGGAAPMEFKPQAQYQLAWPARPAPASATSLEALRPVMVRFFDQAGAEFGQISFFDRAQPVSDDLTVEAGYTDGRLHVTPPKNPAIKASWLVAAREEGIASLSEAVAPQSQPDAVRIEWPAGGAAQSFDLGRGMPVAFLIHETAQGLYSQVVPSGRVPGRQQRATWLDRSKQFGIAAIAALLAGAALLAWHLAATRRKHPVRPQA